MTEIAAGIGKKVLEGAAKKIGEKIAEKTFNEAEERQYRKKLTDFLSSLKDRLLKKKKLLIIGGGEIATEIGIAALLTSKWNVRAIVDQDPECQKDKVGIEQTKVPIANLLNYVDKPPKAAKCYTTIEEANPSVRFQYVVVENLQNLECIKKYIVNEKPDIVLLEDMFLTCDEWTSLHLFVSKELGSNSNVHFIPSPNEECGSNGFIQSEIFLSKVKMKEFLVQIGLSSNLLGIGDNGNVEKINAKALAEKTMNVRKNSELSKIQDYQTIRNAFRKHNKIILKPEMSTSGHGQFIISNVAQTRAKRLSRKLSESLSFVKDYRVENELHVVEQYVENRIETCGIMARSPGKKRVLLDRIYYSKYDMEKVNSGRFKGLTRLVSSETRTGDNQLWTKLNGIIRDIANKLSVPFLYVEFLLDPSQQDSYGIPRIYINEISYRPDDAGFVTLISHKKSQFSIFVQSLMAMLDEKGKAGKTKESYAKAIDTFVCKTLNPRKRIRFYREGLWLDYPARTHPRNRVMVRLYEKHLSESRGEIDYGRIIGYIWHHSSDEDSKTWKYIESMKSALGEEGLNLLKNSVPESAPETPTSSKVNHSLPAHTTIVVSDWEGPWAIADYAYDIMTAVVPNGNRLFSAISEYDDYLAYIRKKKRYEPGDTLALIVPFLIAYDIDKNVLQKTAEKGAKFIDGSIDALKALQKLRYPIRIVSTSYCQYVWYTAPLVGIPQEHTRCTLFPIADFKLQVHEQDKALVRSMIPQILSLGRLGISASSTNKGLPPRARETITKMDEFFWETLPKTSFGPILKNIRPLGGSRKLNTLEAILKTEKRDFRSAVVIGDSITDWVMLNKTRKSGGLAISFNGNSYAIRNASVAVISDNCMITPVLVEIFEKAGLKGIERITRNWSLDNLRTEVANGNLDEGLFDRLQGLKDRPQIPQAYWITSDNLNSIIEKSSVFRKTVRGSEVGSLG